MFWFGLLYVLINLVWQLGYHNLDTQNHDLYKYVTLAV